jgi:hypothetical protein
VRFAPWLGVAAISTLLAAISVPALAQGSEVTTSGTVSQVTLPTASADGEVVLSVPGTPSTSATFTLTPDTAYALTAPGLGATGQAVPDSALMAGETVTVSAPSGSSTPDADAIQISGQVVVGQVSAVSTTGGVTTLSVTAAGTVTQVTEAASMTVLPSGTPAVSDPIAVYGVATGSGAMDGYVAYLSGFPAVTGTIEGATGTVLTLSTDGATFTAAYGPTTPVTVGGANADANFLAVGATATVSYTAGSEGATATAVALPAVTVTGTYQGQTANGSSTLLSITVSGQTQTLTVLAETNLNGLSLSSLQPGATLTATGVQAGTSMIVLSLSETSTTPPPPTAGSAHLMGTVAATSSGQLVLDTPTGPVTLSTSTATTYAVGPFAATAQDVAAGQVVMVAYTGSNAATPTATAVTIVPQLLAGVVSAAGTNGTFTVTNQVGEPVSVTLAPSAQSAAAPSTGDHVFAQGIDQGTGFLAFSVRVGGPPPGGEGPGGAVHGTISAVSAGSLSVTPEHGTAQTVAITSATVVRVGGMIVGADLLATGERATVDTVADPTVAGQLDAVRIQLQPARAMGSVSAVSQSGGATTLTLGAPHPGDRGRGRGHDQAITTVLVEPSTTVRFAAATSGTFQVGQRVVAVGALASAGLMAAEVEVGGPPGGHGPGRGHSGSGGEGSGDRGGLGH